MRFGEEGRGGGNIAVECANKRKMSVGSWPYWREVGKRSRSDTRQARHRSIPLQIHIRGEKFRVVDNLCSTWNQKKARNGEGGKNNFETNFKFYDRVSLEQVALSWRDKRRRKLAEDLAIKAIWIDSLVDSDGESELEMNSRATFFSALLPADK